MAMTAARCAWEVTAGLIPGQPMPEYTRRFGLTSPEWESADGWRLFQEHFDQALDYYRSLQDPRRLNWVRLDWVWF